MEEQKMRVIQEYVPGKQLTLAHVIANPDPVLYTKLGIEERNAIGILTLTPTETAIIAADIATKAASVGIGYLDRFTGSLVLTGEVAAVEMAIEAVNAFLQDKLKFATAPITRS
ncbi:BMC domain-containing protein [Paenibacillus sp. LMG 31458]|uniref:BMC domain-containing protein n=2 Tax=Paenibacillus TaxID=44249 RepID=A0ABX1YT62_9BACL|nr:MULTISPECIES: BMC domain-containing protein [Paenibacillus]MDQ0902261.1 ethanolamine utilization protein EutS [Paenibacillus sp. V4I7]MDQ0919242.1 ethanolamine utilization protein EutS [Paenibacillus sp. V4I5]NOU74025.1 BMC domain-containing protein [Paenibacillus phytorum]NOU84283.1 BMC domain-containing protein [Paenibacillus germinis]